MQIKRLKRIKMKFYNDEAFVARIVKNRKKDKVAKASRKKNRG